MTSACFGKRSLRTARVALDELRLQIRRINTQIDDALAVVPAFSWDPKDASAAKKAAVNAKLFKDKDTGMTDALKAVAVAQKAFDEVVGSKVKPEKKRPAGDKALAAYEKFIPFVNAKLRPLSDAFAWKNYCDAAVKAATEKIGFIRALMVNWP